MRKSFLTIAMVTAAAMAPSITFAKGCLKGAAVGGVAGHVAGHHALIGAAAGCAIEHHRETKAKKKAAEAVSPAQPIASAPRNSLSTDKP